MQNLLFCLTPHNCGAGSYYAAKASAERTLEPPKRKPLLIVALTTEVFALFAFTIFDFNDSSYRVVIYPISLDRILVEPIRKVLLNCIGSRLPQKPVQYLFGGLGGN